MINASMMISGNKQIRLSLGVAGLLWLWLFLLYGRSLYQMTPAEFRSYWAMLGPLTLTLDFLNPVFHSPSAFIGSYLLGIGLIVWAILKLAQRWVWRLGLFTCGMIALMFPFVMPSAYGHYQVPVSAAAGYGLDWITRPTDQYSSAFKQAQLLHQGECDYHILGWSTEGDLSYSSRCVPGIWRYEVSTGQSNWSLVWDKAANLKLGSVTRWDGQLYLEQPPSLKEAMGYPFLTLERAKSPDGRWEAVVVRWFYGPSDIVVVGQAW